MRRYLAGVASALLLVAAGVFLFRSSALGETPAQQTPQRPVIAADQEDRAVSDPLPEAAPRTREQRRFGRYDKDDDGNVTRDEYLASRRKAFAKLDANGDGRLSFDEWATRTTQKFAAADRDRSGGLSAAEFTATAVKRRVPARIACPPRQDQEAD